MQIKPMVKTINQQIYNFNGIIYYLRKIQTGWIYCFFFGVDWVFSALKFWPMGEGRSNLTVNISENNNGTTVNK